MAYTTIDDPAIYFNTVTYTGNGTLATPITGVGFQPDLVWIKNRSAAEEHLWYDAVRGADKLLRSNNTAGDATTSTTVYFNSFDSDGFTIGTETAMNASGQNIVAWNWLGANTTVSNTDGSITSTVSANTTSGFSIVSYTGNGSDNATIGHGLGSSINFVIVKRRNTTSNWLVQGSKVGTGYGQYLELNGIGVISTASDNIKSVSSSLLTLGTNGSCNGSSDTYIAYCFADVQGYSKFGSWTGNGNADGTFVYLGFKPEFVMLKNTNGTNQWLMFDNTREPANVMGTYLQAESSAVEANYDGFDFLSNGMKMITSNDAWNASGNKYIYMAFAENPFVTSTGVPACAR